MKLAERGGPPLLLGSTHRLVPPHMAPLVVTHWSEWWDRRNYEDDAAGVRRGRGAVPAMTEEVIQSLG